MTEQLLRLPTRPGTVIAIGEWWLIRLRPYEGAPSAWELLPLPSGELTERAKRNGVDTQCIYGDDWALAEAEQEGGYLIISDPRAQPSGIQYFKSSPTLASAEEPPNHCQECGAWGTVETHLRGCSRDGMTEEQAQRVSDVRNGGTRVRGRWAGATTGTSVGVAGQGGGPSVTPTVGVIWDGATEVREYPAEDLEIAE